MSILAKLFREPDTKPKVIKATATNPYRLRNAVAGFICLDPEFEPLMETDKLTLGPLFPLVRSSSEAIVQCHILFLYCKIDKDGSVARLKMRVRDLVKASGARVAIVASENLSQHYMHALQPKTIGLQILCL